MNNIRKLTLGIIGGMGPSATVDLMDKIIKNTPAKKDQGHIKMIVDHNPQIPDRRHIFSRMARIQQSLFSPVQEILSNGERISSLYPVIRPMPLLMRYNKTFQFPSSI